MRVEALSLPGRDVEGSGVLGVPRRYPHDESRLGKSEHHLGTSERAAAKRPCDGQDDDGERSHSYTNRSVCGGTFPAPDSRRAGLRIGKGPAPSAAGGPTSAAVDRGHDAALTLGSGVPIV